MGNPTAGALMFKKLISSSFRKPSGIFGWYAARFMTGRNDYVYDGILAALKPSGGMRLLEIGYGLGIGIQKMTQACDLGIDGIDFSRQMHRRAARRNKTLIKAGKVNLMHGDFRNCSLPGKDYDAVVFANVLYFWEDLPTCFSKIKSLLKPTGQLVFYMTDADLLSQVPVFTPDHFHLYKKENVIDILKLCGFVNITEQIQLDDPQRVVISAQIGK
jgi:ubiquinone/menaquinone biosynthesis C-methylase UbiE